MIRNILSIVATPIGNLTDLSPRAREVLASVDLVLCEDTRVTKKLLDAFEIHTPVDSLHQHTTQKDIDDLVVRLTNGENMAYVSDAGTPGISDPGGKFVAEAVKRGVRVTPIPGASASLAALSVCGFPSDTFTFLGFAPNKKGRNTFFEQVAGIEHTVVLYESKHRILKTLAQLPQDRLMMVGRELTKLHETLYRGVASEILTQLDQTSQKGEFVIVLAPKKWN